MRLKNSEMTSRILIMDCYLLNSLNALSRIKEMCYEHAE